jgi:rod shape-determining protein MreD
MQYERFPTLQLIFYLLLMMLFYVLETAHGLRLTIFGFRPELLCGFVAVVALMDGPLLGLIIGLLVGLLYDLGFVGAEGLYPIFFMLFGMAAGLFSQHFLRKIFPSVMLLTACEMLLLGLLRLPALTLLTEGVQPLLYLQQLCGETLLATALSLVVYLPVGHLSRRFRRIYQRRSDD